MQHGMKLLNLRSRSTGYFSLRCIQAFEWYCTMYTKALKNDLDIRSNPSCFQYKSARVNQIKQYRSEKENCLS